MNLAGTKAVAAIAAVAVGGAVLGGAVVYIATRGEPPAQPPQPRTEQTATPEATATPSLPATSSASEEPTAAPSETTETTASSTSRPSDVVDQPTLVVDWSRSGGRIRLTLDYVQVLFGEDANREAARRGLEVPVPNDYLIVNDNPRLRVFPVRPGIMVHVLYNDDGTMSYEGRDISLDAWYARLTGSLADQYSSSYFLVTVRDGEITKIAQQYTP
ncbi:hypothetical protein MX659_04525 [Coriobacteriia bacterium Es71-Z0120]|uniref:hypothetical protein n=1 Tax=Parvivirga hydrogeniphila TaxID=2939460 RepID=UPI002260F88B|nr:hypothetical protein [Parvivirga hydrogeniphila]MCL4078862.1 hypothetical protein [Parvivirga hydrogeniphila]